jgi:hypothetical protein
MSDSPPSSLQGEDSSASEQPFHSLLRFSDHTVRKSCFSDGGVGLRETLAGNLDMTGSNTGFNAQSPIFGPGTTQFLEHPWRLSDLQC